MFIKHGDLRYFWAQKSPQIFELELCSKDCDKQKVHFRNNFAISCDLTRSGGG